MKVSENVQTEIVNRLKRVEGQVRALQRMVADGRDCSDIVTQLSAANKALEQAGFRILAAGLIDCALAGHEGAESPSQSEIDEVERLFMRLT